MSNQFVTCRFGTSARTYTYKNETGIPFTPGDEARVMSPRDEGWVPVIVVDVDVPEPAFECKPVIRHPQKEADE
jgi:hypothetical protein